MYARPLTRNADWKKLIQESYGPPAPHRPPPTQVPAVTMTADSGTTVLPQPGADTAAPDEYVVDRDPEPSAPLLPSVPAPLPTPPHSPAPMPPPVLDTPTPDPLPVAPVESPAPPVVPPEAEPARLSQAPPPATTDQASDTVSSGPVSDHDLAADMQAILAGGVYDPTTGAVRPRGEPPAPQPHSRSRSRSTAPPPNRQPAAASSPLGFERPLPEAPQEQAIFDRIAQSMEYANSFDLGTVELQRRFDAFERDDRARRAPSPVATPASATDTVVAAAPTDPPAAPVAVEPAATLLPLREALGRVGGCGDAAGVVEMALAESEHSAPMFDTGEHVRAGADLYRDQLRVGRDGSVTMSYGQVVALGDFYASIDDLRAADPAEVRTLKALVERSTAYYSAPSGSRSGNPTDAEWQLATGGRYLTLAENNDAHFAPLSTTGGAAGSSLGADHRGTWEYLHDRALREMRALIVADPATPRPTSAMTTNAFGDHFLTDAFAAGHLVNKQAVIRRFQTQFYSGAQLNAAGRRFLQNVARKSFHGALAARFADLEPRDVSILGWHPNIDSASRFGDLLIRIAEDTDGKKVVANLAVKAVHDDLNRQGVQVTNEAGETPWTLTGDGHLNDTTLRVMRQAVQQSVDNLNDPGLPNSGDTAPMLARVWRYVPRPTASGSARITTAITHFTDPASTAFEDAAAALIEHQAEFLASELVRRGHLQPDP